MELCKHIKAREKLNLITKFLISHFNVFEMSCLKNTTFQKVLLG